MTLRFSDLVYGLRATMDEIERPWAAFVGLVELRPSPYVVGDIMCALNPQPGFQDLPQSVVLHPDTVEPARRAAQGVTGRAMTDGELAAFLYWVAHRKKQTAEQG